MALRFGCGPEGDFTGTFEANVRARAGNIALRRDVDGYCGTVERLVLFHKQQEGSGGV